MACINATVAMTLDGEGSELKVIGGRYELRGVAEATGAFRCFLAWDRKLGREVVLRLPPFERVDRGCLLDEVRAWSSLSHPDLVCIYDLLEQGHEMWVVTERVVGENLSAYLNRMGPVNVGWAVKVVKDLIPVLEMVRLQGVKSGRVGLNKLWLQGETGRIKLGLLFDEDTEPEAGQAAGKSGRCCDITDLGLLLASLLVGRDLVAEIHDCSQLPSFLPSLYAELRDKQPQLPSSIQSCLERCLGGELDCRFRDLRELSLALAGVGVRGEKVSEGNTALHSEIGGRRWGGFKFVGWGVIGILLMVAMGAGIYGLRLLFWAPTVRVPRVVGLPLGKATVKLKQVGLGLTVVGERSSNTVEPNRIVSQSPGEGGRLARGQTVAVVISKGPETVKLPDLRGLTVSQAEDKLRDLRLSYKIREEVDTAVPAGQVKSQVPREGEVVAEGSTVELVISRGTDMVLLPQLVGMSLEKADSKLSGLDVSLEVKDYRNNASLPKGVILEQQPPAGERVRAGDKVMVVVSRGLEGLAVPDLEGKPLRNVRRMVSELGLKLRVEDNGADDQIVVMQTPPPGDPVDSSTVITVRTKPTAIVPEVEGMGEEEARRKIEQAGLVVGEVIPVSSEALKGEVVGQKPLGGIEVSPGSEVILYVSDPHKSAPDVVPTATPIAPWQGHDAPSWVE